MLLTAARGAPSAAAGQQKQPQHRQQPLSIARPSAALARPATATAPTPASSALRAARRRDTRTFANARDEAEIARIKAEAERDDPWSGDVAARLVKVALIVGAGAVVATLLSLAQPLISNTVGSFPSA